MTRIALISDTHGQLRPEAVELLRGSEHIIHAGDIGNTEVLEALQAIAPVTAVRGNNDLGGWAKAIPTTAIVEVGGINFFVVHDARDLDIDPLTAGIRVVVSGHSHKSSIKERNDVVFINPGSAGPRRFTFPVSMAEIVIKSGRLKPRIIDIPAEAA